MSAERNMVSFGGAMMAAQETRLRGKMAYLERWWGRWCGLTVDGCLRRLRDDAANWSLLGDAKLKGSKRELEDEVIVPFRLQVQTTMFEFAILVKL